jgi:hypothetical protein
MRSLASSLAFFSALTLQAQSPKLARPEPQAIENIKQFAAAHFDPRENLSCNQVEAQGNTRTVTVEFLDPLAPRHGTPSGIDTTSLFQNVFAASSGTGFEFDHWGNLKGKKLAVYRYSNVMNGKTHAGLVYADPENGAVSRITFRGTDTAAHLFCVAQSR